MAVRTSSQSFVAVGSEIQVNTETANSQSRPSVAGLNDGGFVVTWRAFGQDGSGYGVYGQRYDAFGVVDGGEFLINTTTDNYQSYPSVTELNGGGFVVTWQSGEQDGSGYGIYGQRYESNSYIILSGTDVVENIDGTTASEQFNALGGSDWITPGGGSDTIDGGSGNDMVSFVNLADTLGRTNVQYRLDIDLTTGTAVNHDGSEQLLLSNLERITGTIFADRIKGDAGDNHLRGLGDYDWFVATKGADTIDGGTGQDMISYVDWRNTDANVAHDFFANAGTPPPSGQATGVVVDLQDTSNNTHLAAGHSYVSVERITGSGRQDVFYGDGEQNDFRGLGDYDWFVGSSGGRERYFGGDGIDTVTYFMSTEGVTANLRNGALVNGEETGYGTGGDAALDLYFEIENLVGTNFDDHLTGNSGRNILSGLDGDDFIFGYGGIDQLKGGLGNDTIDGGGSSDYAIFDGNRADYTLTKTSSSEVTVVGADGTDSLINVEYFRFNDTDVTIWELDVI